MLRIFASRVCAETATTFAPAQHALRGMADQPMSEKIKEAAGTAKEKMSGAVQGAKETAQGVKDFVKEAADRVKYDQEGYHDALKNQADKAAQRVQDMGGRVTERVSESMSDMGMMGASVRGDTSNPLAGNDRGGIDIPPASQHKIPSEAAAGKVDEPLGTMPSGTSPLTQKGPHLIKTADGQEASAT